MDKEPFLQNLLRALESGELDSYEYVQRVEAIERSASLEEMEMVANLPPAKAVSSAHLAGEDQGREGEAVAGRDAASGDDRVRAGEGLDAVDLALLARSARSKQRARPVGRKRKGPGYAPLVVVVALLVGLALLGFWLVLRVHNTSSSNSARVGSDAAISHPALVIRG